MEEVRNPALKGKPVGVTQKYLIVTSNYEARARGVTKLTGIKEALAACPELQLVIHLLPEFGMTVSHVDRWTRADACAAGMYHCSS